MSGVPSGTREMRGTSESISPSIQSCPPNCPTVLVYKIKIEMIKAFWPGKPPFALKSKLNHYRGTVNQCTVYYVYYAVSGAALVDGEEDEVGVLRGVPEGEYLVVDVLEGVLVDDAGGAVLLEGAVQATDLPCGTRGSYTIAIGGGWETALSE